MNFNNHVQLVGNLGREPELKTTSKGTNFVRVSLAHNPPTAKNGTVPPTQWYNLVIWGKTAESCAVLKKGQRVLVNGELKVSTYKDASGVDKRSTEIYVNTILSIQKSAAGSSAELP